MEHSIPSIFLFFPHRHISLFTLHISTTHSLFIASLVIAVASVVVDLGCREVAVLPRGLSARETRHPAVCGLATLSVAQLRLQIVCILEYSG